MYPWDEPAKKRKRWIDCAILFLVLVVIPSAMVITTVQPTFRRYPPTEKRLDPDRLRGHVSMLSEILAPRNFRNTANLNKTADYIACHLEQAGGSLTSQTYRVDGHTYRNVIASFGPESDSRIVVGAHYDSFGDTPGADDNASGVAGLIELAYLLGKEQLNQRIELVAYTLEEPPFFRTGNMGSARHAAMLRNGTIDVEVMICLEMIGFFSDRKNSQNFPSILLGWLYPNRGNFIGVVGSLGDRGYIKQIKISMRSATDLPVHAVCLPKGSPGIDYSDHLNYWKNGYKAVMITDTAFMRNRRYHRKSDTAGMLDYDRMAKVVLGVFEAVIRMAQNQK